MALSLRSTSAMSLAQASLLPNLLQSRFIGSTTVGLVSDRPVISCSAMANDNLAVADQRRSANFLPNIWDYDFLQSLHIFHDYDERQSMVEVEKMKDDVKGLIIKAGEMEDPLRSLELIDVVQRLGLQYHFDAEIKHSLGIIYDNPDDTWYSDDLYATALRFRLLRQHGYSVPQGVFKRFMNNQSCTFKEPVAGDVKGMLSLYEASFLGWKGETVMDEAMAFSIEGLKDLRKTNLAPRLAKTVDHALDMPIHWRPNRLEARWFIDAYEEEPDMNPTLLRLAKLDYNMVQSVLQKEIAELTRWWTSLGLSKMTFFRERLAEHYLWTILMLFEPEFETFRIVAGKMTAIITLFDDIYDAFGTPEELELLTNFIDRWDISEIDKLPQEISSCFLALYNTTNEIGLQLTLKRGINVLPYMQKMWANQCKAYLLEGSWYHKEVKPPLEEYLSTAVTSSGGPLVLLCCFLTTEDELTRETLDSVSAMPIIMHCSGLILRLYNDLETSPYELARGDTVKAIQCYMNETGATEGAAREHIKHLARGAWKTMNEAALTGHPFTGPFVDVCLNLGRAAQAIFQYGDGHGIPQHSKENIMSTLVQPVPMDP